MNNVNYYINIIAGFSNFVSPNSQICYGGKIPTDWYLSRQNSIDLMESDIDKIESEVKAVILSEA